MQLSLQSFSLGSTVSVACVEMLRAEFSQRCTNLKTLSLSLSLSREENVGSACLFSSGDNSTVAGGPSDIGCANLRSIRLQRCSHAIIPQLSHVVEFCRSLPVLRDIAIVRLSAGDSDSQQWSCSESGGEGTECSDDPFMQLFDSCMDLESLELSATDAWPAHSLAKLMQIGERGFLDSKPGAQFRRLTVLDTDAFMDSINGGTSVVRPSLQSVGCASATISPTMHYESLRARANAAAARGPTQNFFFGPS